MVILWSFMSKTGVDICSPYETGRRQSAAGICGLPRKPERKDHSHREYLRRPAPEYIENGRYNFVRNRTETALFTNCQGHEMSRQGFWKILKSYVSGAGITDDITPHTLRHSFAVHMLQNGADVKSVQEMMGHSDISSIQMYLDAKAVKMRDVYMKSHPRY